MTTSLRGRIATLGTLRDAAAGCRECPLGAQATQTVWGEGPADAPLVLVGEQPGDREDLAGRPFEAWVADLDKATSALTSRPPAKATARAAPRAEHAAASRSRSTAAA